MAVTLLTVVSGGLRAQASVGAPSAAHTPVKTHRPHAPGPVHPVAVPQGAAAAAPVHAKRGAVAVRQSAISPPAAQDTPVMRAQRAAMRQAEATGKAVVVASLTTARSQVVALPDGRFELISSVVPVRVMRDGAWIPVSTRLIPAAGGGWAPAAVATPLVFSGGGSGPMVTVTDPSSGRSVRVWWPAPLPRPVVSGSVALYRNVFPGVDLRLKAAGDGYGDVLVVHDAAAAASPALRSLAERVQAAAGESIAGGPGGSLVVSGTSTRQPVLTFGRPQMWDSSRTQHFGMPATADLAGSGRVTVVPAAYEPAGAGSAVIVMRPPAAALAGPAVRYPLFIDPTTGDVKISYYAQVMHGNTGFTQAWNKTTGTTSQPNGVTEVGFCGYSSCVWSGGVTSYTDRDYFQFPTSTIDPRSNGTDATIDEVDFNIEETGNSNGCVSQPSAVYSTTGGISSSTTWGGPQGSSLATASSDAGGGTSCQPGFVNFTSSGLKSTLQTVANNGDSTVTLELRAVDESQELQYKTYLDTPTLDVYYNFPPDNPGGLTASDLVQCTSTNYTSGTTPVLTATATDNNPSALNLDYSFDVFDSAGTSVASSGWLTDGGPGWKSGDQATWTVPSGKLSDGNTYHFTVQDRNVPTDGKAGALTSGTATSGSWTVMNAAIAAPAVSSFDYPQPDSSGQWGQAEGEPGVFMVNSGGDSDVAGFAYSFDNSPTVPGDCNYLNNGGLGTSVNSSFLGNGSGELQLVRGSTQELRAPASLTPGRHTLNVLSFNYAHVPSAATSYVFYVPSNFSGVSKPYVTDGSSLVSSATGTNASLVVSQANCCGMTWPSNAQLRFEGTAAGQTFTVPITVPAAGTWHLGADMTVSWNYAQVRVDLDSGTSSAVNLGGTATTPFDGYSATVSGTYLDLGTQTLTAGSHTLTFTATGTDSASTGYEIGLVDFQLSPANRYEADALTWSSTVSGQPHQQCLTEATWADNCQLFFTNSTQGASFDVTFNAPIESDYALGANLVTAKDYGTEQFTLDPATSNISLYGGNTFDAYTANVSAQYVFFGGVHLTAGPHVLQVTVIGQDASSSSYNAGVNFIEAAPITGATESSFTAAMNNQGIAYDSGTATMASNFDLTNTASGNNLSQQALASAGLITLGSNGATGGPWTGSSFSLNGAQFTMPAPRTDSSGNVVADNVIPDGQTIPLPNVYASGVALLVTATCFATPEATVAIAYGQNASGGTVTPGNPIIPSVADWLAGVPGPTVISLGHDDQGPTANTSQQPQLYEVMLPANPGYPLSAITLPVMPVNLLPDSGSCTTSGHVLHILAIGTVPASSGTVPSANGGGVWTGSYNGPMDEALTADQTMPGQTLRESVPLSADGSGAVRVHLSNAYATTPVTFDDVTVAAQSASNAAATLAAPVQLNFGSGNSTSVTIAAGGDAYSNPVAFPALSSTGELTVSMHVKSGTTVSLVPIHHSVAGLVTYYVSGDDTGNSDGTPFSGSSSLQGLYYLAGVDVSDTTATDGTIAVLGDQEAVNAPAWSIVNWPAGLPAQFPLATPAPVPVPGSLVDAATSDAMPDHWWRLNGGGPDSGTTAYDSGTAGTASLALKNTPAWSTARPGTGVSTGSLSLNGTSQYGLTQAPAVTGGSGSSFAVSAWVDLSSVPGGDAVAVAQDGTSASEFYLGSHAGKWGFWFAGTDAASPALTGAYGAAAASGTWTMLTGVYNAAGGQIKLYVNGTLAATTTFTPSWSATGPFTVGSGLVSGAQGDFLPGNVSDVRAYNRMLYGYNVSAIFNDTGMSSLSAAGVASSVVSDHPGSSGLLDYESYAYGEPNLRDVIVSLGANDVLQGTPEATIENDLRTITAAIAGWQISDEPGTPVHAFVTTIPPLGLAATDARETVRQDVNNWLAGNAGATGNLPATVTILDIASAVQDPANSNDINPGYLSGGVPTAAYYQQIATAAANGISAYLVGPPPVTW